MDEQSCFEGRIREEYRHLNGYNPLFLARDDNGIFYSIFTPKDSLPFRKNLGPITAPLFNAEVSESLEGIAKRLNPQFESHTPKDETSESVYELYVGNWSTLERHQVTNDLPFYQDLNGSVLSFEFQRKSRNLRLNFLSVETDYANLQNLGSEEFEILTMLRFYGEKTYVPPNVYDDL